jgi:hypothetical protein
MSSGIQSWGYTVSMRYEKKLAEVEPNACMGKDAHANSDDARYCEICGNRTVYFQSGLLQPYHVVQHEHESARECMTFMEFEELGHRL